MPAGPSTATGDPMTRGVIVAMAVVSVMLPVPTSAQPAGLEERVRTSPREFASTS